MLLTLTVVLTHPQNVVLAQGMKEASNCLLRLQIDHQLNFASKVHVFSALQSCRQGQHRQYEVPMGEDSVDYSHE